MENQETVKTLAEDAAEKYLAAKKVAEKAVEVQAKLDAAKALYEELDALTSQLQELIKPGTENALFIGEKAVTLVDNFATTNLVFRPSACRRFEIKVEEMEKFVKRLKKEVK